MAHQLHIKSFFDFVFDDEFQLNDGWLIEIAKKLGRTRRELKLALLAGDTIKVGRWTYCIPLHELSAKAGA